MGKSLHPLWFRFFIINHFLRKYHSKKEGALGGCFYSIGKISVKLKNFMESIRFHGMLFAGSPS